MVNKTEHQLPMFVITFEPTAGVYVGGGQAAMGLAGMVGGINGAAAQARLLRAMFGGGGFPYGGGPPGQLPRAKAVPAASHARAAPAARKRRRR